MKQHCYQLSSPLFPSVTIRHANILDAIKSINVWADEKIKLSFQIEVIYSPIYE